MEAKHITAAIATAGAIVYFMAALVWFKPLPSYAFDRTAEEVDWCGFAEFFRANVRSHVRLDKTWLESGEYYDFADNGEVIDPQDSSFIDPDAPPTECYFNIVNRNDPDFRWHSAAAPGVSTDYPYLELQTALGSTSHSLVEDNEGEISIDGLFSLEIRSQAQGVLRAELMPVAEIPSSLEEALLCEKLVRSWGTILGRAACPIAIIGS